MPVKPGSNVLITPDSRKFSGAFKKESPLKRLIKIFRSGTPVKYHIQGSTGRSAPEGTAKAFFKNAYSFRSSTIPGYSSYDRFARYSDYSEMESYDIIGKGLNIVADEVTQQDENGKIIKVSSKNENIQKALQDLFDHVLHLNGKEIYKLVRNLCKYGDTFYLIDATEENGVVNLIQMPANEVEREEGFDSQEPSAIRFRWTTKQNLEIPNAYVLHFRLDGNDLFYPYGMSFIEAARRPWRQLVLLEDAMMVYRLSRAPERRVFFLDVMGADPGSVEEIVNKFNQTIRKHKVTNDKGQVDLRYGSTLSIEEDYIIPVRGGDTGTRIETLPGGQRIGDMEDVEYIQKKLFGALGIPKAFLTYDEDIGAKQVLTQEDIRFARTIAKIQEVVVSELVKVAMIHLYLIGYRGTDLTDFKVKMTNPSTVAELQKNELWRARMDLVHSAGEGVFDTEFIYKNFLHLSDDTVDKVRKGQILDKIFQSKLIAIENSQGFASPQDMGLGGMGGMDMGMGVPGGGMDMGGMGGTPELGMTSPETAAPGMGESKNLWKTTDDRSKEDRAVDEIPGVSKDEEIFDSDPTDSKGIGRTIRRPMGARESKKSTKETIKENFDYIQEEFYPVLEEYKKHSKECFGNALDEFIYKEYKINCMPKDARSHSTFLKENFGIDINEEEGNVKGTKVLLKENFMEKKLEEFNKVHENNALEDSFEVLEEKIEKMLKESYKLE